MDCCAGWTRTSIAKYCQPAPHRQGRWPAAPAADSKVNSYHDKSYMFIRTCSLHWMTLTRIQSDFRSLEALKLEGRLQLFQALLSESIPATVGCATWGVDCLTKPRSAARFEWQQGQTSVSGDTSRGIPELSRYMYRYPIKSQNHSFYPWLSCAFLLLWWVD